MSTDTNQSGKRDYSGAEFTVTNYTADVALDCDNDLVATVADVLATVIRELINQGILKGSVATA